MEKKMETTIMGKGLDWKREWKLQNGERVKSGQEDRKHCHGLYRDYYKDPFFDS